MPLSEQPVKGNEKKEKTINLIQPCVGFFKLYKFCVWLFRWRGAGWLWWHVINLEIWDILFYFIFWLDSFSGCWRKHEL